VEIIKIEFERGIFFYVLNVVFYVFYFVGFKMGVLGFVELYIFMFEGVIVSTGLLRVVLCCFVN
jgi:hypothetical protein